MTENIFPKLQIIEDLKNRYIKHLKIDPSEIHIVAIQHILETTGSLFEAIIDLGVKPENIYLTGKIYSLNKYVFYSLKNLGLKMYRPLMPKRFGEIMEEQQMNINNIWKIVTRNTKKNDIIIIIDDGGSALRTIPKELIIDRQVFGIEQTTFGMHYMPSVCYFPVIEVARSAAKKHLEPNFISRALYRKLQSMIKDLYPQVIGVVGCGYIGQAMIRFFSKDYKVIAFDNIDVKNGSINIMPNIESLIEMSDIIIGATGTDISSDVDWEKCAKSNKTLISVSSNDIEFRTLLLKYNDYFVERFSILDDLILPLYNGASLKIIRGGTVANFDNGIESCDKREIEITRALLYAGLLQILNNKMSLRGSASHTPLLPEYQKIIVKKWFEYNQNYIKLYPETFPKLFQSIEWIGKNS